VIQINNDTRQVVVGKDEELYSRTFRARRVNLISTAELREPMRVAVKIRHKHQPAPAVIESPARTKFKSPLTSRNAPSLPARPPFSTMETLSVGGGGSKTSAQLTSLTPRPATAGDYRSLVTSIRLPRLLLPNFYSTFVA
jgi:hypothetical protein